MTAFQRAQDPVDDARDALDRGVPADRVVRRFLPLAVRRGRLAALRAAFERAGHAAAFDRELRALAEAAA